MAVPKKRTSKMKTRLRKAEWKAQAAHQAAKALSKAKTVIKRLLTEKSVSALKEAKTPENFEGS